MQRRTPLLPVFVVLAVVALFAGACEGDGGGGADATGLTDAAPGGPDVGGDAAPGGPDTVAGPDSAGPDAAPVDDTMNAPDVPAGEDTADSRPVFGGVVLWEASSPYLNRAGASAELRRAPLADVPPAIHDRCAVVTVDPTAPAPLPESLDAGTIQLTGGRAPVTLTWSAALAGGGHGYVSDMDPEEEYILPAAGAIVTATAAGGADVPAFTASVATPTPVTLAEPSSLPFASLDTGEALTVRWNPADGETTVVSVNVIDGSYDAAAGAALVCTLEGDPGEYVVPAAAMATLPTGPSFRAIVAVTRIRTASVPVAGGSTTLTVTASGAVVPLVD